jgi:serine/tyrosine/threonine adenylyltransferase
VVTGEMVARETLLPGAVLTRVAASHIRIGTFQYFAARGDTEGLRLLADHAIARHYPDAAAAEHPYGALLENVVRRQADLIARWMLVGFIHGVMNTDNMSIAGETIDYGPCAFMDHYDPAMVFSSIDHHGRYAYANQPKIAVWNLARFAETLLPLLGDDETKAIAQAEEVLAGFAERFQASYLAGMRRKLGLFNVEDGDGQLAQDFLDVLFNSQADFTLAFRRLGEAADDPEAGSLHAVIGRTDLQEAWVARWRERLSREPQSGPARRSAMLAVNPAFIARNHRIEAMIDAAVHRNDFALFEELLAVLARPFDDQPDHAAYMEPPHEHERVTQTFCGT